MEQQPGDSVDMLVQAQVTIMHQAEKIVALQQRLEREEFAQELRHLLISSASVNTILSPFTHTHLLELVVRTAASIISARAGSLFLVDKEAQDLVFEVAIGPVAQEVKKFRVPLGHGIAGLVAISGQPMAVSNASSDARLAKDIATSVNYEPENILCVPLFYEDQVIGVLELLNKIGAPSFQLEDIDTLGLFANIAAVAIAQSQAYKDQQSILSGLLNIFKVSDGKKRQRLYKDMHTFLNWMNAEDTLNLKARELALLVQTLILSGEQECELCITVLRNVADYISAKNTSYTL